MNRHFNSHSYSYSNSLSPPPPSTSPSTSISTSGAVVWYTVDIEVTSPQHESQIDVTAQVRRAVAVDITLGTCT